MYFIYKENVCIILYIIVGGDDGRGIANINEIRQTYYFDVQKIISKIASERDFISFRKMNSLTKGRKLLKWKLADGEIYKHRMSIDRDRETQKSLPKCSCILVTEINKICV